MNQREMQSGTRSKMTLQIHLKAIEGTHPHSAIVLGEQIAYQDAKIERLKKELAEATAKLDSLKVDPAKREEFIAGRYDRFQAEFPAEYRFGWLAQGEQFRAGFAAAIDHAFAAGRASAPEVGELQRQLGEAKQALAKVVDIRSKIFLCDETLDLAIREANLLLEKAPTLLTAAESAELGEVLDAEAADHSGDAAEKVEPPASEARQFVCPKCGGTEHGTRSDYSIYCLRGYALGCGWSGTWAEVEAANEDAQTEVLSDAFRAAAEIEVAMPMSALGVEVSSLKQQLATERQAREAADRQATEKILELERRCNDEHHKCEAAEQRAEQAEAALKQMCDLDEETSRLERESCDALTEGIRAAMDGVKREDCPHKDEPKQTSWLRGHEETESMMEMQRRAEQAEAAAGVMVGVIQQALELCKEADNERLSGQEEAHRESAKWKAEGDMYGWNFHEGKAGGMNEASIIFYRVRRFIEAALASDAGRAAANELRALRTFRAEIEQDYQAWANATIGEAELRIRLGVARNKVDKAIAGQGGTGKEGR